MSVLPHPRATRGLTTLAYALFAVGFVIPFAASDWKGTTLSEHPVAAVATGVLCVAGAWLEWCAYVRRHPEDDRALWLRICEFIGGGASTWLLLGIAFGFVYAPTVSTTVIGTHFNAILAITLAVMGVQISLEAWRQLARDIRPVFIVVALRWIVMPLVGYCISYVAFHPFVSEDLAQQLAIGMILLCTSPTGAASNSMTYIAKGDLALSVSATTVNVLVAPFLQPLLVELLAGNATSVDAAGMFRDLATYVLAPVVIASIVGILIPRVIERIKPTLPAIAVLSLAFVLMGTMSKGASTILGNLGVVWIVVIACLAHGTLGMTLGYYVPKFFGFSTPQRVASSFEIGIENAAIAPALAISYFGPLALLPAVVYGKTQNLLAVTVFVPYFLRKNDREHEAQKSQVESQRVTTQLDNRS